MPETVQGYPKWRGELARGPRMLSIAMQEARRGWENQWIRAALIFCAGLAIITVGQLGFNRRTPTFEPFVNFIGLLRWAALVVASVMAGPSILEDSRRGALELYHSRGVTRADYLAGKTLAVWGLSFAAVAIPGLLYYAVPYALSESQPAGWAWVGPAVLADAAIFSLVVTALGLGLSAASRSARAATLILFGAVAALDLIFGHLLSSLTKAPEVLVLSPLAQMAQQAVWLYPKAKPPYEFPFWWGLIGLGLLFVVGIALVAWRQPRVRGVK